jgi:enterochelin esterase family protein
LSALQAVYTAIRSTGIFAGVLAQSPSAWWQDEWLTSSIPRDGARANRFWLSVGTHEVQENVTHPPTPLIQKTSQLASVRRLANRMTELGHEIHSHEYDGGHDPVCWGAELTQALVWLINAP